MARRIPYIRLFIVLLLFSWYKEYQKIDEPTQQAKKPNEHTELGQSREKPIDNMDTVACSFHIFNFPPLSIYL